MIPKCNRCGRTDIPSNELALVKAGRNSWSLVCRDCLEEGGTVWSDPGELNWLGSYAGLYAPETTQVLNTIKENHGQKADKIADNERRYERHNIVLRGFITTTDAPEERLAVIKDLSKGGIKFVSKTEYQIAQVASIRIERKKTDNPENTISENIEIVRVIPQENGTFEMGARFLSAETADLEKKNNQKKKKNRHNILLRLRYKLSSDSPSISGAVLELGRDSALILITSDLDIGAKFAVQITGNDGVFANQELHGIAEVKRTEYIYPGNFETLIKLVKIHITKR